MEEGQHIYSVDITPTPEAMQRIVAMFQQQIVDSQEKITQVRDLQEALWDNDLQLEQPNLPRSHNKILEEALDLGLARLIEQEEERIQKIEEGLSNE